MPDFKYKAMDGKGQVITGCLTLGSEDEVLDELGSMGCVPISVVERKTKKTGLSLTAALGKAKPRDVAILTRQLATLVRAGIPIVSSLTA
ncbi:type II secretion system F family protein, partial [Planctomycetota bacterium]